MTWRDGEPKIGKLYGDFLTRQLGPERASGAPVEKRHQNIAASLQARLEDAMLAMLNRLYNLYGIKKLCLAGGVAYNCVANGKIFAKTPFEKVYIQSAAGDAGLAIGGAFYVWNQILGHPRSFEMKHTSWGPELDDQVIGKALRAKGVEQGAGSREQGAGNKERRSEIGGQRPPVTSHENISDCGLRIVELSEEELVKAAARKIADGKVVGWFQGRMEFGPRALGNRSIVVDPRRAEMKDILNSRIKHRESFRPFAPSILLERDRRFFRRDPSVTVHAHGVQGEAGEQSVIPAPSRRRQQAPNRRP